ncbi:MAG: hypothetical protein ABIK83_10420 [Candidatus Zixiibacteriota bacterium]
MTYSLTHFIELSIAGFLTLCIFSFLYKDNPFYRLAEHIYAGLSAGYYVGLIWHAVIIQQLWIPISQNHEFSLLVPGMLGLLMFTRFFEKLSFVSRVSIAFVMGNTAGISIMQQLHGYVLPQVGNTISGISDGGDLYAMIGAWVILVGVITTLIYFYFSKEHKGAFGVTARIGIVFIMISFGAHFGYTVMGRVSLLIGRVQFLMFDWVDGLRSLTN